MKVKDRAQQTSDYHFARNVPESYEELDWQIYEDDWLVRNERGQEPSQDERS
jgi:hypothetical protein